MHNFKKKKNVKRFVTKSFADQNRQEKKKTFIFGRTPWTCTFSIQNNQACFNIDNISEKKKKIIYRPAKTHVSLFTSLT